MYKSARTYEINQEALIRIAAEWGHTPETLARYVRFDVRTVKRLLDPNDPRKVVGCGPLRP